MSFSNLQLDERIASSTFLLGNWTLSQVLLKNNANYPWLILVPRVETQVLEIDDLPKALRYQLMDEISELSSIVKALFKPDKINVATLGNIVKQLHIHVVARYKDDMLWPHGIWQEAQSTSPYDDKTLTPLLESLRNHCGA